MTAVDATSSTTPEFTATPFSSPLATVPTERERFAALLAHAGTLLAWFLAPLAVYLLKRGESRWVERQALQSLLWSLAGTGLSLVTCGAAIPVFLFWHVLAAVRIHQGADYDYPIIGDFTRGWVGEPRL